MDNSIEKQVCLITGASRGIGKAIADILGANGYIVIGTATSNSGATSISEYISSKGYSGVGMVLDVRDSSQAEDLIKDLSSKYGDINILVNNAGITQDNLLLRMKRDQWNSCIDTNLNSVFLMSKLCLKNMTRNRFGRIINISSVVGSTGNAGQCNYSASKAGMLGFTKSLALEVASRGITVNAIAPSFIETDMTSELNEKQKTKLLEQIPQRRLGTTLDIAKVALFLCSDAADYITGQVIHVNGGMYLSN